ncbi:unnamed protein product [Polarella glacialis]|uniref:DNA mismatch repair protein S5 domain-containing protein n=1 Tax=Polarella glacialis TaxID=89957 RepID=A0A813G2V0_POLGL|nr:unnamed protein product [Polarella glacialis]
MSADSAAADGAADVDGGQVQERRIVQLEETVINRIAAGEVVVRPANALKELLENSLDAGSKRIAVMVKAGGLKMLRIEDDGHGIRAEDMPILCERFTTSKLRKYEDLSSICTFGFRGEALASISHVSHVTVTTMTAQDTCARMAQYSDGKLKAPPRPCAGTRGTTLVAEDMFYNNATRRQALGKDSIEHARVLEVVQRYAIHNPTVSFGCRKAGGSVAELSSTGGDSATSLDAISVIYGQNLAKELFSFKVSSEDPSFVCRGCATGPNWTGRSSVMIIFINNRLVECGPLRRAVEAVYSPVLPRGQHPWVYLALEVDPATIDVNVHPTKMEVQFLHEETIGQRLQEELAKHLREHGGSRTFAAAMPFLVGKTSTATSSSAKSAAKASGAAARESVQQALPGCATLVPSAPQKEGPQTVVLDPVRIRTDHRQLSLASAWRESQATQATQATSPPQPLADKAREAKPQEADESQIVATQGELVLPQGVEDSAERRAIFQDAQQLTSLEELKVSVRRVADANLSKTLHQSVYVGPVSNELVLLQCGKALCLANLAVLARECAYQRLLRLLGGLGSILLKEPLPLEALLKFGILDPDSGYDPVTHASVDVDSLASRFAEVLKEKAEMLNEYFMMEVDVETSMLKAVPNGLGLSSDANLNFEGLPLYLVNLCTQVNWEDEKVCLDSICKFTADFSVDLLLPTQEQAAALEAACKGSKLAAVEALNASVLAGEFEDVAAAAIAKRPRTSGPQDLQGLRWLHEAVRRDAACCWSTERSADGTVLDLVSLDQLYRIFERC